MPTLAQFKAGMELQISNATMDGTIWIDEARDDWMQIHLQKRDGTYQDTPKFLCRQCFWFITESELYHHYTKARDADNLCAHVQEFLTHALGSWVYQYPEGLIPILTVNQYAKVTQVYENFKIPMVRNHGQFFSDEVLALLSIKGSPSQIIGKFFPFLVSEGISLDTFLDRHTVIFYSLLGTRLHFIPQATLMTPATHDAFWNLIRTFNMTMEWITVHQEIPGFWETWTFPPTQLYGTNIANFPLRPRQAIAQCLSEEGGLTPKVIDLIQARAVIAQL